MMLKQLAVSVLLHALAATEVLGAELPGESGGADDSLEFLLEDAIAGDQGQNQPHDENQPAENRASDNVSQPKSDGAESSVSDEPGGQVAGPDGGAVPTIPVESLSENEEEVAAPSTRSPQSRFIEEIVVTAEKREENVQDVPITVQAFSGELLAAKGVTEPIKLAALTPGMTYTESFGATFIYIRGIGLDAFLTGDPAVAYYVDGVYNPMPFGQNQNFGRVERIEVLKGPQGTLFGRNASGGAVSVITETPDPSGFSASLGAAYRIYDHKNVDSDGYSYNAFFNVPLADSIAATFAGYWDDADHWYSNAPGSPRDDRGIEFPRSTQQGLRAKLRWEPTDRSSLTLSYTDYSQNGVGTLALNNTQPSLVTMLLGGLPSDDDYLSEQEAIDDQQETTSETFSAELKWKTDPMEIRLLGSNQEIGVGDFDYDFDGTSSPIITFGDSAAEGVKTVGIYGTINTAELQFTSEPGWGPDWLKWVGGYYYFDSQLGLDPVASLLSAESVIVGPGGGVALNFFDLISLGLPLGQLLSGLPQPVQQILGPLPLLGGVRFIPAGETQTTAHALYAQIDVDVTDWLGLTLGLRYQDENREVTKSNFSLTTLGGGTIQVFDFVDGSLFPPPTPADKQTLSPKVGLNFRPADGLLFYASWQKISKSGTFNIINIYTGVDELPQEKLEAYEVGAKTEWFDGLLRLNAAAWNYDITDLQVQFISFFTGGAVSFDRAEEARSRGFEFDAQVIVLPSLFDSLVFSAGASMVDAEYIKFTNGRGYNEQTGFLTSRNDFSGLPLNRTPKWTGFASLAKTWNFSWGPLEAAVDGNYQDRTCYVPGSTERFCEEAYTVVNARVSALLERTNVRVTASVNNLENTTYVLSQFPNDFGNNRSLAAPRSYVLRLDWSF